VLVASPSAEGKEGAPTVVSSTAAMLSNADLVMSSPGSDDGAYQDDENGIASRVSKGEKKRRGGRRKRSAEDSSVEEGEGGKLDATAGGTSANSVGMIPVPGEASVVEGNVNDEEESVFGKSQATSSNATWVQCDRCKKWRRLRGVVDAKKLNLPTKWYCNMNKNDPERSKCTAPEEEYDAPITTAPETAADQRTRKHLRLWVRRLQCNEAYEAKLPTMTRQKKKSTSSSAKEPYEWIRCCNPSCGKWRAILKFMDKQTLMDNCKNGEWYCVQNTWDEKIASCAAPQENLPAIGCPPWIMRDED